MVEMNKEISRDATGRGDAYYDHESRSEVRQKSWNKHFQSPALALRRCGEWKRGKLRAPQRPEGATLSGEKFPVRCREFMREMCVNFSSCAELAHPVCAAELSPIKGLQLWRDVQAQSVPRSGFSDTRVATVAFVDG